MENYRAYNLNKLLKSPIEKVVELKPSHSGQKSFYGKAWVIGLKSGVKLLQSYRTIVAAVLPDGRYISNGRYSATTGKHENDFCLQYTGRPSSNEDVLGRKLDYEPTTVKDYVTLAKDRYRREPSYY